MVAAADGMEERIGPMGLKIGRPQELLWNRVEIGREQQIVSMARNVTESEHHARAYLLLHLGIPLENLWHRRVVLLVRDLQPVVSIRRGWCGQVSSVHALAARSLVVRVAIGIE